MLLYNAFIEHQLEENHMMPAVFLCCREAASEKRRAFVTFSPVKSNSRLRKAK